MIAHDTAALVLSNRGPLMSLRDMLGLYASNFSKLQYVLATFARQFPPSRAPQGGSSIHNPDRQYVIRMLREIIPVVESLGIDPNLILISKIGRLVGLLEQSQEDAAADAEIAFQVRDLCTMVQDALMFCVLFFVPFDKSQLYEQDELFGPRVRERFDRAAQHIQEAGNCFALERYTGAVFHLMCVLEVALDSVAHRFSLPYSEKNWNEILRSIEVAVGAIEPSSGPNWKDDKEFYGRAVLHFRFFALAWRNHTAHGRVIYSEGEARKVYDHVKAFMEHISQRLEQRP
jgi:hypothetical protein